MTHGVRGDKLLLREPHQRRLHRAAQQTAASANGSLLLLLLLLLLLAGRPAHDSNPLLLLADRAHSLRQHPRSRPARGGFRDL